MATADAEQSRYTVLNRRSGKEWADKPGEGGRRTAATLDREELQMYVETLAKECDRFEYALTGEDVE